MEKEVFRKSSLHIGREIGRFTVTDLDDNLDNMTESSDSQGR